MTKYCADCEYFEPKGRRDVYGYCNLHRFRICGGAGWPDGRNRECFEPRKQLELFEEEKDV